MLARITSFTLAFALLFTLPATACSDFAIEAKDGTKVVGRTMDFSEPITADAVIHSRGEKWTSPAPKGKDGKQWTQKYGFVGFSCLEMKQLVDGMNEKGLTASLLWHPSVQYQTIPAGQNADALEATYLPAFVMGTCSTIEEVKKALPNVIVWEQKSAEIGMFPALHMAVHDANGNNLVVEYVDGKLHMYDNPIGVMTNDPSFDSQLDNLRGYTNLSEYDHPWTINGVTVTAPSFGNGLLGIPGDYTSPSRFVRLVTLKSFAYQPKDAHAAIIQARHLINSVDVIPGVSRRKVGTTEITDYTQWYLVKDLTNRIIHFASHNDQTLQAINLKKIDFDKKYGTRLPVMAPSGNAIKDVTGQLLK